MPALKMKRRKNVQDKQTGMQLKTNLILIGYKSVSGSSRINAVMLPYASWVPGRAVPPTRQQCYGM